MPDNDEDFDLRASTHGGVGVFAKRYVPKGTRVGTYPGRHIPLSEFQKVVNAAPHRMTNVTRYAVKGYTRRPNGTLNHDWIINPGNADGSLKARYAHRLVPRINEPSAHEVPNAVWVWNILAGTVEVRLKCDLQAGQEVLLCYGNDYKRNYATGCARNPLLHYDIGKGEIKAYSQNTDMFKRAVQESLKSLKRPRTNSGNTTRHTRTRSRINTVNTMNDQNIANNATSTAVRPLWTVRPTLSEIAEMNARVTHDPHRGGVIAKTRLPPFTRVAICFGRVYTEKQHASVFGVSRGVVRDPYAQWTFFKGVDGTWRKGYDVTPSICVEGKARLDPAFEHMGVFPYFQQVPPGQEPEVVTVFNQKRDRMEYWVGRRGAEAGQALRMCYLDQCGPWPDVWLLAHAPGRLMSFNRLATSQAGAHALKHLGYSSREIARLAARYRPEIEKTVPFKPLSNRELKAGQIIRAAWMKQPKFFGQALVAALRHMICQGWAATPQRCLDTVMVPYNQNLSVVLVQRKPNYIAMYFRRRKPYAFMDEIGIWAPDAKTLVTFLQFIPGNINANTFLELNKAPRNSTRLPGIVWVWAGAGEEDDERYNKMIETDPKALYNQDVSKAIGQALEPHFKYVIVR